MQVVKRLSIPLLVLAIMLATASVATAHYFNYSATNSNGRIIYEYNSTLWQKYRDYSNRAVGAWNNEKAKTNSANWPFMDNKTSRNTATLNVGGCTAQQGCDGSIGGYYQHYPGAREDIIRLDQQLINTGSQLYQQRTVMHEFGHAGVLAHNSERCDQSVMKGTLNCGAGDTLISYPGPHDTADVNNAPRVWNTNGAPPPVSKRTVIDVERYKDGDLASKTIAYPNGSYRILEYVPQEAR